MLVTRYNWLSDFPGARLVFLAAAEAAEATVEKTAPATETAVKKLEEVLKDIQQQKPPYTERDKLAYEREINGILQTLTDSQKPPLPSINYASFETIQASLTVVIKALKPTEEAVQAEAVTALTEVQIEPITIESIKTLGQQHVNIGAALTALNQLKSAKEQEANPPEAGKTPASVTLRQSFVGKFGPYTEPSIKAAVEGVNGSAAENEITEINKQISLLTAAKQQLTDQLKKGLKAYVDKYGLSNIGTVINSLPPDMQNEFRLDMMGKTAELLSKPTLEKFNNFVKGLETCNDDEIKAAFLPPFVDNFILTYYEVSIIDVPEPVGQTQKKLTTKAIANKRLPAEAFDTDDKITQYGTAVQSFADRYPEYLLFVCQKKNPTQFTEEAVTSILGKDSAAAGVLKMLQDKSQALEDRLKEPGFKDHLDHAFRELKPFGMLAMFFGMLGMLFGSDKGSLLFFSGVTMFAGKDAADMLKDVFTGGVAQGIGAELNKLIRGNRNQDDFPQDSNLDGLKDGEKGMIHLLDKNNVPIGRVLEAFTDTSPDSTKIQALVKDYNFVDGYRGFAKKGWEMAKGLFGGDSAPTAAEMTKMTDDLNSLFKNDKMCPWLKTLQNKAKDENNQTQEWTANFGEERTIATAKSDANTLKSFVADLAEDKKTGDIPDKQQALTTALGDQNATIDALDAASQALREALAAQNVLNVPALTAAADTVTVSSKDKFIDAWEKMYNYQAKNGTNNKQSGDTSGDSVSTGRTGGEPTRQTMDGL